MIVEPRRFELLTSALQRRIMLLDRELRPAPVANPHHRG